MTTRYIIRSCTCCEDPENALRDFRDTEPMYNPFGIEDEEVFTDKRAALDAFLTRYNETVLTADERGIWQTDFALDSETLDDSGELFDEDTMMISRIPDYTPFPVLVNGVQLRFEPTTLSWKEI